VRRLNRAAQAQYMQKESNSASLDLLDRGARILQACGATVKTEFDAPQLVLGTAFCPIAVRNCLA
jgi:hypothetical protein